MLEDLSNLSKPIPATLVRWRVGAVSGDKTRGLALAYIDARTVFDALDAGVGPEAWATDFRVVGSLTYGGIGIRIGEAWVWRWDTGGEREIEHGDHADANAAKSIPSDALKRAAVQWGIGRNLYASGRNWVPLDDRKQIPEQIERGLREQYHQRWFPDEPIQEAAGGAEVGSEIESGPGAEVPPSTGVRQARSSDPRPAEQQHLGHGDAAPAGRSSPPAGKKSYGRGYPITQKQAYRMVAMALARRQELIAVDPKITTREILSVCCAPYLEHLNDIRAANNKDNLAAALTKQLIAPQPYERICEAIQEYIGEGGAPETQNDDIPF